MPETIGTLNLKIARLYQRLQVLERQQALSGNYADHRNKLIQEAIKVKNQLHQLVLYREALATRVTGYMNERYFDGDSQRGQSVYSAY